MTKQICSFVWVRVLSFFRKKLDGSAVRKQDKFPSPFQVILDVEWDKSGNGMYREASWQNLPYPKASPLTCFFTITEQEEVLKQLGTCIHITLSIELEKWPNTVILLSWI